MFDENTAFVGSIPENYDRHLGPVALSPYAEDLAKRLTLGTEGSVLELACGTGILTRRLLDCLPPTVSILATDLSDAMLNYAARKFFAQENVQWKQADAHELPFSDQSFDAVVCQFGVMFFPVKSKAFAEAYRVLKPGTVFLFNVWDAIEENVLSHIAHTTISDFFEDNPPDFYEIPFSFHDAETIKSLLMSAGFEDVKIEVVSLLAKAVSARDVTKGLVYGNPVIAAIRERDETRLPEIEAAIASEIVRRCGDEPVNARTRALVCSAVKPATKVGLTRS